MTTHTVSYDKLEGAAKRGKAIQDIINYLGAERFAEISELLHKSYKLNEFAKYNDKAYVFALMMTGVQGYPVRAWFELLFGEVKDEPE